MIILAAVMLCGMCGCSNGGSSQSTDDTSDVGAVVYQNSDGAVVFEFDDTNSFEEVGGKIADRRNEKTFTVLKDGISQKKAEEIVDSCTFTAFYLPSPVKNYQKYYYGNVELGGKEYYSMYFYIEKSGIKMFAGTNFLVASDGSQVYSADWSGSYKEVKINSASQDIDTKELYKDAKITPEEALLLLNKAEAESLKLKESLYAYTFEIDAKLYEKKSILCYRITPKLQYENGISLSEPIYVTADGTNRILMADSTGEDYRQVL